MEFKIFTNQQEWINSILKEFDSLTKNSLVGLSGGSTPKPVYEKITNFAPTYVTIDERSLKPFANDTNQQMIRAQMPNANCVFFDLALPPSDSLSKMDQFLHTNLSLDLLVLGMGEDGHIASIFTDAKILKQNETTFYTETTNEFPFRYSFNMETLSKFKRKILLITGQTKFPIQGTGQTDTTISISWNPGNDVRRIKDYVVYWDTDSGGTSAYAFNSRSHPGQVSFAGPTATISGLTPGTTYYVTVTSRSDFTDPSSGIVTTYESILYPTQVSGDPNFVYPVEVQAATSGGACVPTAEEQDLRVSESNGVIELCWQPVSDPCLVGYDVLGAATPASAAGFSTVGQTAGVETCWSGTPASSYFLVVPRGTGGTGPWGHYQR